MYANLRHIAHTIAHSVKEHRIRRDVAVLVSRLIRALPLRDLLEGRAERFASEQQQHDAAHAIHSRRVSCTHAGTVVWWDERPRARRKRKNRGVIATSP